jgi:hypothetical protein
MTSTGDLDGVWRVTRVSGLLPPLVGVRKRIVGTSGRTEVGPLPGVPFAVAGLSLRYRRPFGAFVDQLTPVTPDTYLGHATVAGRRFGTFRMTRLP